MSSADSVQQAETREVLQGARAEELGERGGIIGRQIQDAAAQGDSTEVAQLATRQQEMTRMLNENYQWLAQQVEDIGELGDREGLQAVGAGLARHGLLGGLTELQKVVLGRQVAAERDALADELDARMIQLADYFREPDEPPPPEPEAEADAGEAGSDTTSSSSDGAGTSAVSPASSAPADP